MILLYHWFIDIWITRLSVVFRLLQFFSIMLGISKPGGIANNAPSGPRWSSWLLIPFQYVGLQIRDVKVGLHDLGINGNMVNFALFLLLLPHNSMIKLQLAQGCYRTTWIHRTGWSHHVKTSRGLISASVSHGTTPGVQPVVSSILAQLCCFPLQNLVWFCKSERQMDREESTKASHLCAQNLL